MSGALAGLGRDLRTKTPTLAALGLGGLDVTGLVGFARSGLFPQPFPESTVRTRSGRHNPHKRARMSAIAPARQTTLRPPPRPTSPALSALLEHPPRTGRRSVSNDLHSGAPRATLSGMANDCPVLMVLLWCQSVNDDVRLHDGAPAAQGRESCLEWDYP